MPADSHVEVLQVVGPDRECDERHTLGDDRSVQFGERFPAGLPSAADIAIVGRSNLVERSYDQTAVVSANVGNTLPLVGVVVAGPQVAAALLLFSQIFKKPLQDMGRVYYRVSGSYDEPTVESSDVAAFGASGQLANCVD